MVAKGSFKIGIFIFLLASVLFFPPPSKVYAAQVTLAWNASTDPTVVGYKIHYGTATRNYPAVVDVGNRTTCTIANLSGGRAYFFAATGYDAAGHESGYSNEVAYTLPSSCTFSLSPASYSSNSSGGPGTVQVGSQAGCTWTVPLPFPPLVTVREYWEAPVWLIVRILPAMVMVPVREVPFGLGKTE